MLVSACGSSGETSTFGGGGQPPGALDATTNPEPPPLGGDATASDGSPSATCRPLTCSQIGATCGKQGDGCGNVLDCGNCAPGQTCGGVQLHVADREAFRPVRTSLALLAALRAEAPERFAWRTEPYEFVADRPAVDLLFGSDRERLALDAGTTPRAIAAAWEAEEEAFRARRREFFIY